MNTRNHGGKRAGSGAKRGSIYAPTRRKQALRAEWQAAVALRFGGLIEAQLRAAMGASAVVAKMDGTWASIRSSTTRGHSATDSPSSRTARRASMASSPARCVSLLPQKRAPSFVSHLP